MKPLSSCKTGLFCLLFFSIISGYGPMALAHLGDPSSETVSASPNAGNDAPAPLLDAELNTEDDDQSYETIEVADASGRKSYKKRPKKVPSGWPNEPNCNRIYSQVKATVGGKKAVADCLMGFFYIETDCRPTLDQAAGNAGNAHAAYGLCSIEKSLKVRKDAHRGPNCINIQGVTNQTKCCRDMLNNSPTQFGPYNRGVIRQCG
jgi:hypothetical protein